LDFLQRFKERLDILRNNLSEENFQACENMSTDILRSSEFVNFSEGVFIGEFFEAMFSNVKLLTYGFNVEKKDVEKIQASIFPIVDFMKANIPIDGMNKKAQFYDLLNCTIFSYRNSNLLLANEKT
jgi:hypothetical protein